MRSTIRKAFRRARVGSRLSMISGNLAAMDSPYWEEVTLMELKARDRDDILAARLSGFTPDYKARSRCYPWRHWGTVRPLPL